MGTRQAFIQDAGMWDVGWDDGGQDVLNYYVPGV